MNKLSTAILISVFFLIAGCSNNKEKKIMVGDSCWLDGVNGSNELLVSISQPPIVFDGWAINRPLQKAPASVVIQLSNEKGLIDAVASSDEMLLRPDIVKAFGNKSYEKSGFKVIMDDVNKIPKGEYTISVVLINEKTSLFCSIKQKLILN